MVEGSFQSFPFISCCSAGICARRPASLTEVICPHQSLLCGAEGLVVLIEDLSRWNGRTGRFLPQTSAVHRSEMSIFAIFASSLSRCTVHFGTGWRTEHQGIGQNCRAEQSCDTLFNLDSIFAVHLVDDGCGAAKRLIAEINWIDALQSSQTVMVNDFQNICTLYPRPQPDSSRCGRLRLPVFSR